MKKKEINSIADLKPDKRNARKHNPRNIGMIESSLQELGAGRSILIDEDNNIIAGNGTIEAAASAGITKLQVVDTEGDTIIAVRRSNLTAKQKKRMAVADNRTAELADWDAEVLGELAGEELLAGLFSDDELAGLLQLDPDPAGEPPDPKTELRAELMEKWKTESGQVWELGASRLWCGDSTDMAKVEKYLSGVAIGAVVYDPPFDDDKLISSYPIPKEPNDLFVFGDCMTDTDRRCDVGGRPWRYQFIWDGVTRWIIPSWPVQAHKSCSWFSHKKKYNHDVVRDNREKQEDATWKNKRGEVVIEADPRGKALQSVFRSPVTQEGHGAEHSKPVLWMGMIIGNCSTGDVFDPFCGSGTSILACELSGRACYAIEMNPEYCAVILERYEEATGIKPKKQKNKI
jgi:hypothetical protein